MTNFIMLMEDEEPEYELIESFIEVNMDYRALFHPDETHLHVATSGGKGHETALQAIFTFYPETSLTAHMPINYKQKSSTLVRNSMHFLSSLTQLSFFTERQESPLRQGINKLNKTEPRYFVDVALDCYDDGYEMIALYNELQRQDQKAWLNRAVNLQPVNDEWNAKKVCKFFFDKLMKAQYDTKRPYHKIISTQPLSLPAICDAVIQYNSEMQRCQMVGHENVIIEQFITDLPTLGATHFFNALKSLTADQKKVMNIHAVQLKPQILDHFFKDNCAFNRICSIDPKNNPMVHPAFRSGADPLERQKNKITH